MLSKVALAQWRSADTSLTHRSLDSFATFAMQEPTVSALSATRNELTGTGTCVLHHSPIYA